MVDSLYVLIDDHVVTARVGHGCQPLLSDSELITLAVVQVLQGYHCEDRGTRVVAALLAHNHYLIRTGQILLADKGFAGQEFTQLTDAMGLRLLRPGRKDETYRNGNLGGVCQWIESVNQTLKGSSTSKATAAGIPPECSSASHDFTELLI